jgi:ribosomal protein L7Ae-like RNA K-turn-binding protein
MISKPRNPIGQSIDILGNDERADLREDFSRKSIMINENRALSCVGLCKRAGALITGFDACVRDIAKAKALFIASDVSEKTAKEMRFYAGKHKKPLFLLPAAMDALSGVLGKRTGVLSVTDEGLAKVVIACCERAEVAET